MVAARHGGFHSRKSNVSVACAIAVRCVIARVKRRVHKVINGPKFKVYIQVALVPH